MGGKALSVKSVRLGAARYRVVERETVERLRAAFPGRRIESVIAYANKADFGDLDVLIDGAEADDPQAFARALQASEVVVNGDVSSMGIAVAEGIFQVDLISIPLASFDFAVRYFGLNDMGNLLGRVAHKFGAKFGHLGLLYPIRDPGNGTHLIAEVSVTNDFGLALRLIGYDAARYEALRGGGGFAGLNDIFAYVVSSRFVNRDIYLLENRNHKSRIRDSKRPTYNAFLAWLAQQASGSLPAYPWAEDGSLERARQKQEFLHAAFQACPEFETAYRQAMAEYAQKQAVKRRFNGELAGAVTGLSGKSLGQAMARVRDSFCDEAAFAAFFMQASDAEIAACFLRHAKNEEAHRA